MRRSYIDCGFVRSAFDGGLSRSMKNGPPHECPTVLTPKKAVVGLPLKGLNVVKDMDVAAELSVLMIELSKRVDDSIRLVMETCDREDFEAYRRGAGRVMGSILLDVLEPLWRAHPSLKPPGNH